MVSSTFTHYYPHYIVISSVFVAITRKYIGRYVSDLEDSRCDV